MALADGRYVLQTRLAVGGMGEVWRAKDLASGEIVAVKVLREEYTGDAISLQRLSIEAKNASMLLHPNIATVFDYREEAGSGYLVMELVEGPSLADVLAEDLTIAPLRLLPILIQAALGLHAAHTAGVIHRDVKPGNILLGPGDHVKLTDFGISVAAGQVTLTDQGKVMGTAQYLAPEQALGQPPSPSGDLYALGVVAYEALVGERPFAGTNQVAIALAQVRELPPSLPASIEPSLANLVMSLLKKDPVGRPADGAVLAAHLTEVLETHRQLARRFLAVKREPVLPETGDVFELTDTAAAAIEITNQPAEFVLGVDLQPLPVDLTEEGVAENNFAPVLEAASELGPNGPTLDGPVEAFLRSATVRRPPYPGGQGYPGVQAMPKRVSWVSQWLVPALIALTLLAMIVIGLFAVLGDPGDTSGVPARPSFCLDEPKRGIIIPDSAAVVAGTREG